MKIHRSEFVISNTDPKSCPVSTIPEYAFIGRSNVGKSSLINMITAHKGLAKTSGRPGKTQLINHFIIDDAWYLVDLPGYGYARVSKTERVKWMDFIREYMLNRKNLTCVVVLLDSRLEPQKVDLDFLEWLGVNSLPFVIAFTKSDKNGTSKLSKNIDIYKKELLKTWEQLPPIFITSAESGLGKEDILDYIGATNESIKG